MSVSGDTASPQHRFRRAPRIPFGIWALLFRVAIGATPAFPVQVPPRLERGGAVDPGQSTGGSRRALRSGRGRANAQALFYLASVQAQQRKLIPAKKTLERLLGLDEAFPSAHLLMGLILEQREQWDPAERHLRKACAADRQNPRAFAALGRVLLAGQQLQGSRGGAEGMRGIWIPKSDGRPLSRQCLLWGRKLAEALPLAWRSTLLKIHRTTIWRFGWPPATWRRDATRRRQLCCSSAWCRLIPSRRSCT